MPACPAGRLSGLLNELELGLADDDAVARAKRLRGDGNAVDDGSVGGAKVGDDPNALRRARELGMLAACADVLDDDVVAGLAAKGDRG